MTSMIMVWTTAPETSTESVPRGPPLLTLHEGVYSVSLGMVTLWNIMNSHCHRARMNKTTQTVGNIRRARAENMQTESRNGSLLCPTIFLNIGFERPVILTRTQYVSYRTDGDRWRNEPKVETPEISHLSAFPMNINLEIVILPLGLFYVMGRSSTAHLTKFKGEKSSRKHNQPLPPTFRRIVKCSGMSTNCQERGYRRGPWGSFCTPCFSERRRPNGTDLSSHTLDHHITTRGVHTSNEGSVGQALVSGVTERPGMSSVSRQPVGSEPKVSKAYDFPTHLGTVMPLPETEHWTLFLNHDGGRIDPTDLLDWRTDSTQANNPHDGNGPTGSSQE
ncbi:hypothetical protein TREMEDRAFT_60165 [Tremella mesenterica DSM 1558]|uniref:uncharacterized protein n=1 Tax=Tremella mesenterica (strain ATCC 24925 / CBS 8224 / DSM 1558 / NBRC 9311 / NRRL Y-6157 / RJB 2259-6 / UBC 559-6) TaxID=578456 RepID=UPI0003F49F8A|nr:uncharacterized protein TREMEDRAFT_60165 [Tremella mesenterica DSM 1558]EIW71230.1 hypothetical protein TREMEDRAFT_60165 [Tremella mesenterica DSM 1558]